LTEYIGMLAAIRNKHAALKYGGYRQIYLQYRRPFIFERFFNDEQIFICVNISENTENVNLPGDSFVDLLRGGQTSGHIQILPYFAGIYKKEHTQSRAEENSVI